MRAKNAINTITHSRMNLVIFAVATLAMAAMYYYALTMSVPFDVFIHSNSPAFVILQILFSIGNSVAGAVSIVLIIELFRIQKQIGKTNIFQSTLSLFISVATTGCYVCGSILLPTLGLAASFAALPLGGLEIKVITLVLLVYSINDLNNKLLGICKVYNDRFVKLKLDDISLELNLKRIFQLKPTFITLGLVSLIFVLPVILPHFIKGGLNDPTQYSCSSGIHN